MGPSDVLPDLTPDATPDATPEVVPAAHEGAPLLLEDLLLDVSELAPLARRQADGGEWLDTLFLLAAISQVLDDHLHRSRTWTKRLTEHAARDGAGSRGRAVARVARGLSSARGGLDEARGRYRALAARRDQVVPVAVDVAEAVLGHGRHPDLAGAVRTALTGSWLDDVPGLLTVPSCFRGFDQHPADLVALAGDLAARYPDRDRPVAVFGVRTSGAYLGPLLAAALRAEGFAVEATGIRPTDRLDDGQRSVLARLGTRGLAVVVDDPPVSGRSLADTSDLLTDAGLESEQVVVAIAVPDEEAAVPPALAGRPVVVLAGGRWHLEACCSVDAVAPVLASLVAPGLTVGDVVAVDWPGPAHPEVAATASRRHRRGAFRVTVRDEAGRDSRRTLLVESVGQGLFGRHALAVAHRLDGWVPESIGFVDGCHFQWLPDAVADDPSGGELGGAEVGRYLLARHRALSVDVDRTLAFEGRQSVWEVAAEVLSGALGPAATPLRPRVVGPAVRRMLAVAAPSVVDGRMAADSFLVAPGDGPVVKLAASEGAFSHRDLASYDPAFDVAAFADAPIGGDVRRTWEDEVGRVIEPERWLLHRLVHSWDRRRHGRSGAATTESVRRALHDYLGEVALADLPPPAPDARVVALDVDGVLETYVLGTSAPGLDGIMAVRSLVAHGYRVVPVTGRSAPDVADRLAAWHLPAGVAEYGAFLVDGPTGARTDLRSEGDRAAVASARDVVVTLDGVEIDPAYAGIVRAYRRDAAGRRTGLSVDDLDRVRSALPDPGTVTIVPGEDQSDLTPATCTKATGLTALLARGVGSTAATERPALAVGDGPADLVMLALAEQAAVPRHAAALAGPGMLVTHRPYQAGLAEAVGRLVGHEPGGCPACALDLTPASRFVLSALSLRAAGPAAIGPRLTTVARTAAAVVRSAR